MKTSQSTDRRLFYAFAAGADIVKIATMANDVADSAAVLSLLQNPIGKFIAILMHTPLGTLPNE